MTKKLLHQSEKMSSTQLTAVFEVFKCNQMIMVTKKPQNQQKVPLLRAKIISKRLKTAKNRANKGLILRKDMT
jgi:hypothetical protein